MPIQGHTNEVDDSKQSGRSGESRLTTDSLAHANALETPFGSSTKARDIALFRSNASILNRTGVPPLQRRWMALRVAQTAGNQSFQRLLLQRGTVGVSHTNLIQRDDPTEGPEANPPLADVEALLRQLPVDTPEGRDQTGQVLTSALQLLQVRGGALEGAGARLPPVAGLPIRVAALISQLQSERYSDVAATLIRIGGDVATTVSILTSAAVELEAISVTSGAAQAGVILGELGAAAPMLALSVAILIAVASIPSDVNQNLWKIFYIADVSGILASWIFNDDTISPHSQLLAEARHGGYFGTDLSDSVGTARLKATEVWRSQFADNPGRVQETREAVGDDYRVFWRALGGMLESRLQPTPNGIGVSNINRLIHGVSRRREERREREEARRREEDLWRYGGVITTPDGLELVLPPEEE